MSDRGLLSAYEISVLAFGWEQCRPDKPPIVNKASNRFVIHYVYNGSGMLRVGRASESIREGDAFVCFPNDESSYQPCAEDPWKYLWFEFIGPSAMRLCLEAGFTSESRVRRQMRKGVGFDLLWRLMEFPRHPVALELYALGCIYRLFGRMSKKNMAGSASSEKEDIAAEHVEYAIRFINERFTDPVVSAAGIAEAAGLTHGYLADIFKRRVGMTIRQYIVSKRIHYACDLLENSDLSIKQIALQAGYRDDHYFMRQFREVKGIPAQHFRGEQRKRQRQMESRYASAEHFSSDGRVFFQYINVSHKISFEQIEQLQDMGKASLSPEEALFCMVSEGALRMGGGLSVHLQAGQAAIFTDTELELFPIGSEQVKAVFLRVRGKAIPYLCQSGGFQNACHKVDADAKLVRAFSEALRVVRKSPPSEKLSAVCNLFSCFITAVSQGMKEQTQDDVSKATMYINEHYAEPGLSPQKIGQMLFVDVAHLSRTVLKRTGISISVMIRQKRIGRAMELLSESKNNIKDLYEEVGFCDQRAFVRSFRQITGYTPSEYQKKIGRIQHQNMHKYLEI